MRKMIFRIIIILVILFVAAIALHLIVNGLNNGNILEAIRKIHGG